MRARTEASPRAQRPEHAPRPPKAKGEVLKIPKPDPINEQVVIAACIVAPEWRKKLTPIIPPDSFFGAGHAEIWEVLRELEAKGLSYDPATVKQLSGGKVDTDYLDTLIQQRPVAPPNLMHHVEMLRWDRTRIEVIRGPVASFLEAVRDPLTEPGKLQTLARNIGGALSGFGSQRYLRDPEHLKAGVMAGIRQRRAGKAIYPFGLPGFDTYGPDEEKAGQYRMIPGLAPGKMTVITGTPGSAKTTVTAQIACAQLELGRKVLYGAWEQGSELTFELMASQSLRISRSLLSAGQITDEEEAAIEQEIERLSSCVRFVELPFGRDKGKKVLNDGSLDLLHEMIVTSGCEVVIFDLWRRALRQLDPDEEEIALYRQQAILQETGAHGILIHQLRAKDLEQRVDKRPTREAIKGSGAWIEVPDTILGVHREAIFKDVPDNVLQLVIMKQRHGTAPLAVDFDWDADLGLLTNGRGVLYERAGMQTTGGGDGSMDSFLAGGAGAPGHGGGGGGFNGRKKRK